MNNIIFNDRTNELYILDQTLLPNEEKVILTDTPEKMYDAVKMLKVRGAPAIGIYAGYCMAVMAKKAVEEMNFLRLFDVLDYLDEFAEYLNSSRPTAVNLRHATDRMLSRALTCTAAALVSDMADEAKKIHSENIEECTKISEYGLSLLKDGCGILTHCNAGPLATSKYGTALGPILLGTERGMTFHVFADETRPLLQGARLTAYELEKAGVDVTLICDSMANTVMKKGLVDAVLVGSDRIAANGDIANKIGTCSVAILAKHYGIPFYVLAPSSTVDPDCPTGNDIIIEERDPDEIKTMFFEKPMAPENVKCFNPSFDVTDHELITAIITENGIMLPPFDKLK